jgi:hypothetical protein
MWGMGALIPTFVMAAGVAWVKHLTLVAAITAAVAALSGFGNWRMLRDIEGVMSRRLAIKSGEKQSLASGASALIGLLVPAGDLFKDDYGWAILFGVLVVASGVLQSVKATPPGLLYLFLGYRPHKATIEAGTVELWLSGKSQLSPGDVVLAAEPEQKLWIGKIADV